MKLNVSVAFVLIVVAWSHMLIISVETEQPIPPIITVTAPLRVGTTVLVCCRLLGTPVKTRSLGEIKEFHLGSRAVDMTGNRHIAKQCSRLQVAMEHHVTSVVCMGWYRVENDTEVIWTMGEKKLTVFELSQPSITFTGTPDLCVSESRCWECSVDTTFDDMPQEFSMVFVGENLEGFPNSTCPNCSATKRPAEGPDTAVRLDRYTVRGRVCLKSPQRGPGRIECRVSHAAMCGSYLHVEDSFYASGTTAASSSYNAQAGAWADSGAVLVVQSVLLALGVFMLAWRASRVKPETPVAVVGEEDPESVKDDGQALSRRITEDIRKPSCKPKDDKPKSSPQDGPSETMPQKAPSQSQPQGVPPGPVPQAIPGRPAPGAIAGRSGPEAIPSRSSSSSCSSSSSWVTIHPGCAKMASAFAHINRLIRYCEDGNDLTVQCMVNSHPGLVNRTNSQGETALHAAASKGQVNIVRFLCQVGAKANLSDRKGNTPLHRAVKFGSRSFGYGDPAQRSAVKRRRRSVVKELLKSEHVDIDARDGLKGTALNLAIEVEDEELVGTLMNRGASVNHADSNNTTPLLHAVHNKYTDMVRLLLSKGNCDVNIKSCDGYTPLLEACMEKEEDIVRMLLQSNVDVDYYCPRERTTAVHIAIRNKMSPCLIVEMVHKMTDVNKKDGWGFTPLILAFELNQVEVVQALLKCNADITCTYFSSRAALQRAADLGHVGHISWLLRRQNPVGVNDLGDSDRTALRLACREEHRAIGDAQMHKRAGVTATGRVGNIPLMLAEQ